MFGSFKLVLNMEAILYYLSSMESPLREVPLYVALECQRTYGGVLVSAQMSPTRSTHMSHQNTSIPKDLATVEVVCNIPPTSAL